MTTVTVSEPAGSRLYSAASESLTLLGRSIRHNLRSIDAMLTAVALPVMILLLFVYVFGGAIDIGIDYVDYVVPGIILLCAGFGSANTAIAVNQDMTNGVIDRFRSLPILSSAVLVGHVVASVLRNLLTTAVVFGLALLLGFSPAAGLGAWLAVIGLLALFMAGISWLAAAFGLLARSAEGAGAFMFVVMFLPYLSSAFVPTQTMPTALRTVAEHQPITPLIETLRGLLVGTPVDGNGLVAVTWCIGFVLAGWLAASVLFRRRTS